MANVFTKQTLEDGERNVVIHAFLDSDGASGEISNGVLVDFSALSGSATDVKVVGIHSTLSNFAAKLSWDATTNVDFLQLIDGETDWCWRKAGGIHNNAGAGKTGDILISTNGFGAAGDTGSITIYCVKNH